MKLPLAVAAALLAPLASACAPSTRPSVAPPAERETRVQDSGGDVHLLRNQASLVAEEVGAPLQATWEALRAAYEAYDIPLGTFEPQEGRMGSPRFRARRLGGQRMSRWVDCGSTITGPRADLYEVYLTVTSVVEPAGEATTRIYTVVEGSARPSGVSGSEVHCGSRGRLEPALVEAVRETLAGG